MEPTAFLSTIAASAAALVAIVGGLLVSRVISLATERGGLQQRLHDLAAERDLAEDRRRDLDKQLLGYDLERCLSSCRWQFIEGNGVSIAEVISENAPDRQFDELGQRIQAEATRFDAIRKTLGPAFDKNYGHMTREQFTTTAKIPVPKAEGEDWDDVWDVLKEQNGDLPGAGLLRSLSTIAAKPSSKKILSMNAEQTLRRDLDNADAAMRSLDSKLSQAELALAQVAKPVGVTPGLVVLACVVFSGVIIPLVLMALGVESLDRIGAFLVLGSFATGLVGLMVYVWAEVQRLVNPDSRTTRSKTKSRVAEFLAKVIFTWG